jgi:hypothetical protein
MLAATFLLMLTFSQYFLSMSSWLPGAAHHQVLQLLHTRKSASLLHRCDFHYLETIKQIGTVCLAAFLWHIVARRRHINLAGLHLSESRQLHQRYELDAHPGLSR